MRFGDSLPSIMPSLCGVIGMPVLFPKIMHLLCSLFVQHGCLLFFKFTFFSRPAWLTNRGGISVHVDSRNFLRKCLPTCKAASCVSNKRFNNSFIHACMHAFIHAFIYTFIHSFIHSCIHSLMHSLIHAFIDSLIH